ncbi:MAG: pyrimidine dimer DNA glycosylase/endonuclease V [Smithellaceae bacterium]|nr:pyrimidine dimer DNA glycosylase/endonuclease V [Smithellaceae bacterium]
MRLWSLHPRYLDSKGLVALWREALLAQKVLRGQTEGYRHHPQLQRFRAHVDPLAAISSYLRYVLAEARRRNFRFNEDLIGKEPPCPPLEVTEEELRQEWHHLREKLKVRDAVRYHSGSAYDLPEPHPLFRIKKEKRTRSS